MVVEFFFDSYALFELLEKNPKYLPYENRSFILTIFNVAEVVYFVLKDWGIDAAREMYQDLLEHVVEVDEETLLSAVRLRHEYNKRKLSYTDCIGYVCALRKKIPFLTGDRQFHDLPNVEFLPA